MTGDAIRHWCARASYPGLDRFMFGTVHLDRKDGESAARIALEQAMLKVLPAGFAIHEVLPGQMTFTPHGDGP